VDVAVLSASREKRVAAAGDLPAYTLRRSPRARHVRLTVTPRDGLVVVVPARLRGFDPEPVLRERAEWIASAQAHFAERSAALAGGAEALLPHEIEFAATGERFDVEYRTTASATVRARSGAGLVVVSGDVEDADACLAALHRWLQAAARERLLPLIAEEADTAGLSYARATVRGQRSRWGGCSASGAITLNRCLLFLDPELARAVVRHELAHLVEPNHSKAFWRELERLDPRAHAHRQAIRDAWDRVPPWAEP